MWDTDDIGIKVEALENTPDDGNITDPVTALYSGIHDNHDAHISQLNVAKRVDTTMESLEPPIPGPSVISVKVEVIAEESIEPPPPCPSVKVEVTAVESLGPPSGKLKVAVLENLEHLPPSCPSVEVEMKPLVSNESSDVYVSVLPSQSTVVESSAVPAVKIENTIDETGDVEDKEKSTSVISLTPPPRRPKSNRARIEIVRKVLRSYRCRICLAPVGSIQLLLEHLNTEHHIEVKETPRIVLPSERNEKEDLENISKLLESIDKRQKTSTDSPDIENDGTLVQSSNDFVGLNKDLKDRTTDSKFLRCEHCFTDFRICHRYRYEDHLKSHEDGKTCNCSFCGMSFLFQFHLQTHLRGLDGATSYIHQCSHCDSSFVNRRCLLFHLTTHDGLHRCTICEMIFPTSIDLGIHTRENHSTPKLGLHSCSECNAISKSSNALRMHLLRIHYKVTCPFCQAAFTTRIGCEQHIKRMHTETQGQRPFHCTMCSQSFTAKAYITRHYRQVHNQEPPGAPGSTNPVPSTPKKTVSVVASESSTRASMRANKVKQSYNEETDSDNEYFATEFVRQKSRRRYKMEVEMSTDSNSEQSAEDNVCSICFKLFSSPWNLTRHERGVHMKFGNQYSTRRLKTTVRNTLQTDEELDIEPREQELDIQPPEQELDIQSPEVPEPEFDIQPREKELNTKLLEKEVDNKPRKSPSPINTDSESSLTPEYVFKDDRPFKCEICPWQFDTQYKLTRHYKCCSISSPSKVKIPARSLVQMKRIKRNRNLPKKSERVVNQNIDQDQDPGKVENQNINVELEAQQDSGNQNMDIDHQKDAAEFPDQNIDIEHQKDAGELTDQNVEIEPQQDAGKLSVQENVDTSQNNQPEDEFVNNFPKVMKDGAVEIKTVEFLKQLKLATCPYCSKRLTSKQSVISHIQSFHPDKKKDKMSLQKVSVPCPFCKDKKRDFCSKPGLIKHIQMFHSGRKNTDNLKHFRAKKQVKKAKKRIKIGSGTESSSETEENNLMDFENSNVLTEASEDRLPTEIPSNTSNLAQGSSVDLGKYQVNIDHLRDVGTSETLTHRSSHSPLAPSMDEGQSSEVNGASISELHQSSHTETLAYSLEMVKNEILGGTWDCHPLPETSASASCSSVIKDEPEAEIHMDDPPCNQRLSPKMEIDQEKYIEPKMEGEGCTYSAEVKSVQEKILDVSPSVEQIHACGVCHETFQTKHDQVRHTLRNHSTRK